MSVFIRILLTLSIYVNRKNITIFMTYLYVLTLVVLIGSHVRLSKDYELRDSSLKRYFKRSLSEYNNRGGVYTQDNDYDINKGDVVLKPLNYLNKRNDPFREMEGQHEHPAPDSSKDNPGKRMDGKIGIDDDGVKDIVPEKKTQINKPRRATSKYPNVDIVDNFHFNTVPEVKKNIFQNITKDGTFLVFSAILDNINGQPYIKILAINGNTFLPKIYCEMTFETSVIVTTKGRIWMLPDHHEKMYKTVFLYCPLPHDGVPRYVSIIPVTDPVRLQKLPVMHHPKLLRNFTVCLSPIYFNYSIAHELVQWFEINRLIGADLFIVYNYSTVGRTDEILKHYEKEGWIEIVQWNLPGYSDLHYYGQIAMMNDCLFRNYNISKYMVNIDVDELIIPRKGKTTWMELMTSLPKSFCEYSFRSTLMPSESKDVFEGKQRARELNLYFLLRMTRREYIFGKTVRSKYIVNTTCIDTVGIHFCWKYRNGTADTQRYHVTPRDALAYHFRNEPVARKGKEVEEKAVYKYHTQLIENARARWDKINAERNLLKEKHKTKRLL